MNTMIAPTALQEILAVLESVTAALRCDDLDRVRGLADRAMTLLQTRRLDSCDRMTLQIVLGRIHRAGGQALVQAIQSRMSA